MSRSGSSASRRRRSPLSATRAEPASRRKGTRRTVSTSEYATDRGLATAPREKVVSRPEIVVPHGIKEKPRGWLEWLTTTDHKKIGLLYLFTTFLFFIIGGVEALMM